jgi:hypothetical protein
MHSIDALEGCFSGHYSKSAGKGCNAAAAVTAHGAFPAIGIEIAHGKIETNAFLKYDQPISAYSKPAVAKTLYQAGIEKGVVTFPFVDHDEIISCSMIFRKVNKHRGLDVKKG